MLNPKKSCDTFKTFIKRILQKQVIQTIDLLEIVAKCRIKCQNCKIVFFEIYLLTLHLMPPKKLWQRLQNTEQVMKLEKKSFPQQ